MRSFNQMIVRLISKYPTPRLLIDCKRSWHEKLQSAMTNSPSFSYQSFAHEHIFLIWGTTKTSLIFVVYPLLLENKTNCYCVVWSKFNKNKLSLQFVSSSYVLIFRSRMKDIYVKQMYSLIRKIILVIIHNSFGIFVK